MIIRYCISTSHLHGMEKVIVWALVVAYLKHFVAGHVAAREVFVVVVAAAVVPSALFESSERCHPAFYQHGQPINAGKNSLNSKK